MAIDASLIQAAALACALTGQALAQPGATVGLPIGAGLAPPSAPVPAEATPAGAARPAAVAPRSAKEPAGTVRRPRCRAPSAAGTTADDGGRGSLRRIRGGGSDATCRRRLKG